jgi:carbon monoxide dehydrogenase subunit G
MISRRIHSLVFAAAFVTAADCQAASIRKEIRIAAAPEAVWDAVTDFPNVHTRLVPGFVTESKMDGDARIVTFANGSTARELLVTNDKERRRLVYAVAGGRVVQHSASVEVLSDGSGGSIVVWTTDVLPDALAPYIQAQMDEASRVMKRFLETVHPK